MSFQSLKTGGWVMGNEKKYRRQLNRVLSHLKRQALPQQAQAKSQATHPPGSKSWHSEAVRPSLAELAISSTYWGKEGDLDIEYSLVFQKMSF